MSHRAQNPQPPFGSVAVVGAGVGEAARAGLGHELPVVARAAEADAQYSEVVGVARLAGRLGRSKSRQVPSSGSDHELSDPSSGIGATVGIEGGEALVVVIVGYQHD